MYPGRYQFFDLVARSDVYPQCSSIETLPIVEITLRKQGKVEQEEESGGVPINRWHKAGTINRVDSTMSRVWVGSDIMGISTIYPRVKSCKILVLGDDSSQRKMHTRFCVLLDL